MSSKTTGGKGGKSKTSAETKVLTTRSSKAGLQVGHDSIERAGGRGKWGEAKWSGAKARNVQQTVV